MNHEEFIDKVQLERHKKLDENADLPYIEVSFPPKKDFESYNLANKLIPPPAFSLTDEFASDNQIPSLSVNIPFIPFDEKQLNQTSIELPPPNDSDSEGSLVTSEENSKLLILNEKIFKPQDAHLFEGFQVRFEKIVPAILLPNNTCAIFISDVNLGFSLSVIYDTIIVLSTTEPLFISHSFYFRKIESENSILQALRPFIE